MRESSDSRLFLLRTLTETRKKTSERAKNFNLIKGVKEEAR